MANNLTIESPNFEKIEKEAGPFTSDAISLLWAALNDTRKVERMDFRRASETLAPKVKVLAPSASVDNLDLEGASVLQFTGGSAQNLTGMRAPETGRTRVLVISVTGAGTITVKHNVTSESANQIVCSSGADTAVATNGGMVLVYLTGKWREVA
jgi:hypothetical protein